MFLDTLLKIQVNTYIGMQNVDLALQARSEADLTIQTAMKKCEALIEVQLTT